MHGPTPTGGLPPAGAATSDVSPATYRHRMNANRQSLVLMVVGVALIALAAGVWTGLVPNFFEDDPASDLETVTGFGQITIPTGPTPTPAAAFPPPSDSPIARLLIPSAEIDAPVVVLGVDDEGVREAPDNAFDTAWYDFSSRPGSGGNAVFSGHVDYVNVGKAVFWNIKDLEPGDAIDVRLEDGTEYRYSVSFKQQYDAATAPVDQIIGVTPKESVTLITCSGTFNSSTGQYDKRLVVRAERV